MDTENSGNAFAYERLLEDAASEPAAGAVPATPPPPAEPPAANAPPPEASVAAEKPAPWKRLASVDAYRGFVMLLMMAEVLHFRRVSEAIGLTQSEMDLEEGAVRVTGKRGKTRWVPLPPASTRWLT